jgi:hypothetical protein
VIQGSLQIVCGFSGGQQFCDGAEAVSTATSVVKIAVVLSGGSQQTANFAEVVTSTIEYLTTGDPSDGLLLINSLADLNAALDDGTLSPQAPPNFTVNNGDGSSETFTPSDLSVYDTDYGTYDYIDDPFAIGYY